VFIKDLGMSLREYVLKSKFELFCLLTDIEKIKKIVVPDFEMLGKLTALRFIEWCQLNPAGVISLATGKTPKTFIVWVEYFIKNWNDASVQAELLEWGLDCNAKPDFSKFYLVQMDEYFPINASDEKSFYSYIQSNYIKKFGFSPKNCLLINLQDLSLLQAEKFALDFETKIQALGGIGFFLGGIGPDGHVAFNFKGSDHDSLTRVLPINYESAASASASFGGIEFIRSKLVLTIGLKTITQNPTSTAVVIADGVGKAKVVQQAIESNPSSRYPATALQKMAGATFYLTESAASELKTYKYSVFKNSADKVNFWGQQVLIDLALGKNKGIDQLTRIEVEQDFLGKLLLEQHVDLNDFVKKTCTGLKRKINRGLENYSGKTFLHTSPHPDDALLGLFPFINQHSGDKTTNHFFATMTSGSNTVQNDYFLVLLNNLEQCLDSILPLSFDQDKDVSDYISALIQNSNELKIRALSSRLLRNFIKFMNLNLHDKDLINLIKTKIIEIRGLIAQGLKDSFILDLKGGIREWEEDLVWGNLGFGRSNVSHLNLGFYSSKDKNIEFERDVKPVLNLIEKVQPDIITVALDPKNGGHPTHYKVRQIITQALKVYSESVQMDSTSSPRTDSSKTVRPEHVEGSLERSGKKPIEIWGYNNVWFKFSPAQANLYLTATSDDFVALNSIFCNCYRSQVAAAVPSPEHDGPFSELMQKIMFDQFRTIYSCLGADYFEKNADRRIVAAKGLMFVRSMTVDELIKIYDE